MIFLFFFSMLSLSEDRWVKSYDQGLLRTFLWPLAIRYFSNKKYVFLKKLQLCLFDQKPEPRPCPR